MNNSIFLIQSYWFCNTHKTFMLLKFELLSFYRNEEPFFCNSELFLLSNLYFFLGFLNGIFFLILCMCSKNKIFFTCVSGRSIQRHFLHYVFMNFQLICFFKLHFFLFFTVWTSLEFTYENFLEFYVFFLCTFFSKRGVHSSKQNYVLSLYRVVEQ